jgi:hypothetical protein
MTARIRLPRLSSLVILSTLFAVRTARADNAPTCGEAFDDSQVKRDDGKLLEARQLLRICGGSSCLPTQQSLCSQWLADVETRVPSVVLVAKDRAGRDLADVKVTLDGAPIATRLDGRAFDVDPGLHKFVFELVSGVKAETTAVANERSKGIVVSVTLDAGGAEPVPGAPSGPATNTGDGAVLVPPSGPRSANGSGLRTAGIVVGATGIVGLVVGAVFGVDALSTKSAHCSGDLCDDGASSRAYGQATASTVGFVAGGVLLAGGVTLWVLAPKSGASKPAMGFAVVPATGRGGEAQLAGTW